MNFTDWSKNNPDKSLNDFYRENALAAELQRSKNEFIREAPSSSPFWSYLTIALSVLIGAFLLYAFQKYNEAHNDPANAYANANSPEANQLFYVDNSAAERHRKFEHDQKYLSVNWRELITVEYSGGDQLGLTGGFRNVDIIVTNKTEYPVDEVTVSINVMGILGRVCHSRIVTLNDIASFDNNTSLFSHGECGQTMSVRVIGFKCSALKYTLTPRD